MDYFANILNIMMVFILLSISAHVVLGRCGLLSLGQAGFCAVGAYTSALLTKSGVLANAPFASFAAVGLIAVLVAAGAAGLLGVATLKLRGDYLAVVTLCFAEVIRLLIVTTDSVGGARGLGNIAGTANVYVNATCVALVIGLVVRLSKCALGRNWVAVREDELVAECMGLRTRHAKVAAFAVSGGIAGLAGHLYCQTQSFVHPSVFNFQQSVVILLMVILGGLGSLPGAVLGAVFFTLMPEMLRFCGPHVADYRMVIFPVLVILITLYRPKGILGAR